MSGFAVALGLLLLNLGMIAAVLVLSPTPRRAEIRPSETDRCFVCARSDFETSVSDYPVCTACKEEYFRSA